MEKSIEQIWKDGFLKSDALVAPKLNNLYDQKSKHIVDKFKRMFKINLIAIVIGSLIVLAASFVLGIPIMGIGLFIVLNTIVIVNRKLEKGLLKIDVNVNSYQYIKSFDNWMNEQIEINSKMARVYYPLIFLSVVIGFWFSDHARKIIEQPNEIYFVNGIPVFWLIAVGLIMGVLAFFGGRLYKWDLNIVYGRVLKKLNEILNDMDKLRA